MRLVARIPSASLVRWIGTLAAGLALTLVTAAQGGFQGEGFTLSSSPGGADQREFVSADTLHMLVWSDRVDRNRIRRSSWTLRSGSTSFSGSLRDNRDGSFGASFTLGQLPAGTTWTWSARLEDRNRRRYTPEATISIVEDAPQPPDPDPGPPSTSSLRYGMNSSENVWSQTAIAFADAMARASEFLRIVNGSVTPQLAPVIPLGSGRLGAGWPDLAAMPSNERPGARIFGSMQGTAPDGRTTPYVLTWEGSGSCRLIGPLVLSETRRTSNRVEYFIDPMRGGGDGQLVWVMDSSSTFNPVRNVHLWLPGMEAQKPIFWPPFLQKLQAMNGGHGPDTWRTLDWAQIRQYGRTDGPAPFVFDLAGRITPASPSQGTRRGVCPEFQVALCNAVGANLHLPIPHQTDQMSDADYERFVREELLVVRDGSPGVPGVNGGQPFAGLAPGLTVTVAYSNEIWNTGFLVNGWMHERAQANGRTFEQQIAVETARVFSIARQVFSGADAPRLRTYVGGWIANSNFVQRILSALPNGVQVDALGPASYFRPLNSSISAWLDGATSSSCPNCPTPEEVVQASLLSIPVISGKLEEHRQIAASYHNPDGSTPALELYEGGASYIAGFQPWAEAAAAAQVIPAMYFAYVNDLVPTLKQGGVSLINWYSFVSSNSVQGGGGAGPFGHWDNMNQTITLPVPAVYRDEGAPKAAAVYRGPPPD